MNGLQGTINFFAVAAHSGGQGGYFSPHIVEIQMYGPRQGPCLGPNFKFFWKRFLYVIILIQISTKISIHSLSYHSLNPLFLFFQISARSSLKNSKTENGPRQGTFPYMIQKCYLKVSNTNSLNFRCKFEVERIVIDQIVIGL